MRKYYFINKFDTNNIDKQDKQTTIIYRNYSSKLTDQSLILQIKRYCKKKSINFYLSNDIRLAIKLDLDGAYIPAFNKSLNIYPTLLRKTLKLLDQHTTLKRLELKKIKMSEKFFYLLCLKKIKIF